MLLLPTAKMIRRCLFLALVVGVGCDQVVPPGQPLQQPIDSVQRDDDVADELIIPGNGPIRRDDEPLHTPLLEGLKQQVEQMPASKETDGVVHKLSEQLFDADALYSEAKRRNRTAIQQANRQVRIGAAKQSPNFLLITVDRLGIGDLGCFGQTHWQTPRIDELAESGAKFTNFYAGGCDSPAGRQSLMSGRLAASNHSSQSASALPRVLWNAGYKTALMGDWSSDSSLGSLGYEDWSGWNSLTNEHPDWAELNGQRITLEDNVNDQKKVRKADFLLSEVRSFMRDRRYRRDQFFLHVPVKLFAAPGGAVTRADYQQRIQYIDELVGRVFDILNEFELTNNTVVCFTADAGPHPALSSLISETQSVREFRFSGDGLSEGNLRVPCVIRWPREMPSSQVSDSVVGAWDLLPTFAELARTTRPLTRVDGRTLTGIWRQKLPVAERRLAWRSNSPDKAFAVRNGHWKALRLENLGVELFNLNEDPGERHNLAGAQPAILKRLISAETPAAVSQ